ncbi:MAG: hypothetical protein ACOC0E_03575 [Spirochaetota bacterium]
MSEERRDSDRTPASYISTIVVNIAMLWFVNAIPGWDWRFITGDFPAVLWAMNLSIGAHIAGNALLLLFHPRFLHYAVQAIMETVSLLALIIVVTVYPFDFAAVLWRGADVLARVVLYVGIGGTIIAIIVHSLRAVGAFFGSTKD